MSGRLILVAALLLAGAAPAVGASPPKALPGEATLIAVKVARTPAVITGEAVDVCLLRQPAVRGAEVRAVSCKTGQAWCTALVRVPEQKALQVLAHYDFERPPSAVRAGAGC